MSELETQRLLKEIALIAEKAYRRGFQQGHLAALGKLSGPAPTAQAVAKWRFASHSKTHAVGAPGSVWAGRRDSLLNRLKCEIDDPDSIIENLLQLTRRR